MVLKKIKLDKALTDRFKKIEAVLDKLKQDSNPNLIHIFRVETKKLKALIRLLRFNLKNPAVVKFPKPLNELYQSMGSLREWQIQKKKIEKACGDLKLSEPKAYLHRINRKTDSCKRRVRKLTNHFQTLKKYLNRILENSPTIFKPETITLFILDKVHSVQLILLSGKFDDESMHEIRKKIKDIQYIISGAAKTGETDEKSSTLKPIQELSAMLGDYHDLCISLELLKKEIETIRIETSEKKLLRQINENWQAEKMKLHKHAIESTRTLVDSYYSERRLN
jgi:CHAD domain-containing protein